MTEYLRLKQTCRLQLMSFAAGTVGLLHYSDCHHHCCCSPDASAPTARPKMVTNAKADKMNNIRIFDCIATFLRRCQPGGFAFGVDLHYAVDSRNGAAWQSSVDTKEAVICDGTLVRRQTSCQKLSFALGRSRDLPGRLNNPPAWCALLCIMGGAATTRTSHSF